MLRRRAGKNLSMRRPLVSKTGNRWLLSVTICRVGRPPVPTSSSTPVRSVQSAKKTPLKVPRSLGKSVPSIQTLTVTDCLEYERKKYRWVRYDGAEEQQKSSRKASTEEESVKERKRRKWDPGEGSPFLEAKEQPAAYFNTHAGY